MTSHFSTLFECLTWEEKSVTGRFDKLRLQKLGFYCIYKSSQKVELGATVKQIKPKEAAGLEPETARLQVQHSDHWATLPPLLDIDVFSFGNMINEIKSSAFMSYYILIV